jgi:hypothetical protein
VSPLAPIALMESVAMDGRIQSLFGGGRPSAFDRLMLALSFSIVTWIVFAH